MIRASDIRVWSALAVIGLSFFVVRQAVNVAAFGWNVTLIDDDNTRDRMAPFSDAPLVGFLARRLLLQSAPANEPSEHTVEVVDFLTRAPLSSEGWLDFARAKFRVENAPAKVAAALALSNLTGPNEGWIAARRVAFALPLWPALPPDSRRGLAADLTGPGFDNLEAPQRFALNVALRTALPKTREEIRATLLLAGKKGEAIAKALGLEQPVTPRPTANAQQNDVEVSGENAPGGEGAVPKASVPSGALSPSPLAPPATWQPTMK